MIEFIERHDLEELVAYACIFTFIIIPGLLAFILGIIFSVAWVFTGR